MSQPDGYPPVPRGKRRYIAAVTDAPDSPVPDADSYEQQLPAATRDPDLVEPRGIAVDVPEADAIEQAQPGPVLDEDDAPR